MDKFTWVPKKGDQACPQCEAYARQLEILLKRFEERTALIPDLQAEIKKLAAESGKKN